MSGSVGHTYIYNFIILFIVIVFAFLAGTLSYYKAFKVNNIIVNSIEKYEGYNNLSKNEVEKKLGNIGYTIEEANCNETYKKMKLITVEDNPNIYNYCIYVDADLKPGSYHNFGVVTKMNIDLPIINRLTLPVFTKTNRIYVFTNS